MKSVPPLCLLILILLTACIPSPAPETLPDPLHDWKPADLRWLNPAAGNASDLDSLVAFYLRDRGSDLDFRLDLLDLQDPLAFDLYLALDTQPGGTSHLPFGKNADLDWDLLLVFPANGQPGAVLPGGASSSQVLPRILRDPFLDCILIQVNPAGLPGDLNRLHAQAFLTRPGTTEITSQTPSISYSTPSPAPARLMLAFWNVLPAETPAQALRHWDGAHTGPSGQRHGLSVLLNASERWKIPLALLDLKVPPSLAALQLLGGLGQVQTLELSGLAELPQTASGDGPSAARSLVRSQAVSTSYQMRESPLAFGPFLEPLPHSAAAFFAVLPDSTRILDWNGLRLIPLPRPVFQAPTPAQLAQDVSENGLSLEIKQALLQAAASGDPARLVVLGGDLSTSAWGDFSVSAPVMEYLASHPWIEVLDRQALLALPALTIASWPVPGCEDLLCSPAGSDSIPYNTSGQPISSGLTARTIRTDTYAEIQNLAPSTFQALAWDAYFSLSRPSANEELRVLQANLIGQVGYLAAAARWSAAPMEKIDCQVDLDWDGVPECILSTGQLFSILKPDLGCLVLLADQTGPLILPTSLVSYGLSDPAAWQPKMGLRADPGVIPGAFCAGHPLQPALEKNGVRLGDAIRYSIDQQTLTVEFLTAQPPEIKIPILLAQPGASYWNLPQILPSPSQLDQVWSQAAGRLKLTSIPAPASLKIDTAFDSRNVMDQPENPDRSYPPGHYLPFPFAIAQFTIESPAVITLKVCEQICTNP